MKLTFLAVILLLIAAHTNPAHAQETRLIEYGTLIRGYSQRDTVTRYHLNGTAGEIVYITGEFDGMYTYLSLLDPSGASVALFNRYWGTDEGVLGPYRLTATGWYTLEVSVRYFPEHENAVGAYYFRAERVTAIDPIDYDQTRTVMLTSDAPVAALLFNPGRNGYYSVSAESEVDTSLRVITSSQRIDAEDEDSGAGFNPEITRMISRVLDSIYIIVRATHLPEGRTEVQITVRQEIPTLLTLEPQFFNATERGVFFLFRVRDTGSVQMMSVILVAMNGAPTTATISASIGDEIGFSTFTQNGDFLSLTVPFFEGVDEYTIRLLVSSEGGVKYRIYAIAPGG